MSNRIHRHRKKRGFSPYKYNSLSGDLLNDDLITTEAGTANPASVSLSPFLAILLLLVVAGILVGILFAVFYWDNLLLFSKSSPSPTTTPPILGTGDNGGGGSSSSTAVSILSSTMATSSTLPPISSSSTPALSSPVYSSSSLPVIPPSSPPFSMSSSSSSSSSGIYIILGTPLTVFVNDYYGHTNDANRLDGGSDSIVNSALYFPTFQDRTTFVRYDASPEPFLLTNPFTLSFYLKATQTPIATTTNAVIVAANSALVSNANNPIWSLEFAQVGSSSANCPHTNSLWFYFINATTTEALCSSSSIPQNIVTQIVLDWIYPTASLYVNGILDSQHIFQSFHIPSSTPVVSYCYGCQNTFQGYMNNSYIYAGTVGPIPPTLSYACTNPSNLTIGCIAPYQPLIWLNAGNVATGLSSGQAVTSWTDISGNGNNAVVQYNDISPPIYYSNTINGVYPAVYYNGSMGLIAPSVFPLNQNFTIIALVNASYYVESPYGAVNILSAVTSSGNTHAFSVFSNAGNSWSRYPSLFQSNAGGNPAGFIAPNNPVTVPLNQFVILSVSYNIYTLTGTFYEGGKIKGTGSFPPGTAPVGDNSICIGCFLSGGGAYHLSGYLGQVLLFPQALNQTAISFIESVVMSATGLVYPQSWS